MDRYHLRSGSFDVAFVVASYFVAATSITLGSFALQWPSRSPPHKRHKDVDDDTSFGSFAVGAGYLNDTLCPHAPLIVHYSNYFALVLRQRASFHF